MNLSQEAQALRDYLSIRGLNDGEIERAMGRVVDMALERAIERVDRFERSMADEGDGPIAASIRMLKYEK